MEKRSQIEEIKRTEGLTKKIIKGKDKKDVAAQRILLLGRSGVGKTYNGCRYLL
jgi:hypothetical protein